MLLELKNITMCFDAPESAETGSQKEQVEILHDVSFSLDRGQSMAIVAPSGAGKSTLLSIAGLLLKPSAGSVFIDGVEASALSDDERSALRARSIGFLFQHTQLIGSLRAIENVLLPVDFALSGHAGADQRACAEERAKAMMAEFCLTERTYHYPFQLSVGQKRRVATARALVLDPPLIIADDPTNELDAENTERVVNALFRGVESGQAGLLFATHDMSLAKRADHVLNIAE